MCELWVGGSGGKNPEIRDQKDELVAIYQLLLNCEGEKEQNNSCLISPPTQF